MTIDHMPHVRLKTRLRIGARDEHDRPIWHALRGPRVATGPTPVRALHNMIHVVPTRSKLP